MNLRFPDKQAAREHVWERLDAEKLAAYPLPPRGRIPNFKGALEAARNLFTLEPWASARRIKVNPDSPQRYVRRIALERGIDLYVPTPKLAGGFMLLDPKRIPPDAFHKASARANWDQYAIPIALDDLPHMDAIVAGSVAVTEDGRRAGKGAGYSDLEFAMLRELGHPPVPVATTVHDAQWVESIPTEAFDQRMAAIATPTRAWLTGADPADAPDHIDWSRIDDAALKAMPPLADIKRRV
ncbi:MAG: 5-formyltetrahydrofolate cyclo-ligase [Alphaproteobacteria bacterium]